MAVFPQDPIEFAVEFVRKLRNHPDVIQIPSSRQVLSIPKLILSRYYRKGRVNANDFIEISRVTSFPDNQELAKDIAFEILFPKYQKDKFSQYFTDRGTTQKEKENLLSSQEKSQLEKLQDLIEEIKMSQEGKDIQEIEKFIDKMNQDREQEPFKSALNFFKDDSELYQEEIGSVEELINAAKKRFSDRINSLSPQELKAGSELGFNDLLDEKSIREWEKIVGKALNNQNIEKDLANLMNSDNFDNLIQTLKFLKETNAIDQKKFNELKNQLGEKIKNLDNLFNTAKNIGELPEFNKNEVLKNSINDGNFDHNFNLANSMDQFFSTELRKSLLEKYNNLSGNKFNISLENLANNAFANKDWNDLFNKAFKNAINNAEKSKRQSEAFKDLSHQLQQYMNSCHNVHCGQKISKKLPEMMSKTLKASKNPAQLKDSVEFLRKIGLKPNPEEIEEIGKELGMSEEEIYELIEPNYELLRKLVEKNKADYQRLKNLMNLLSDLLNKDRIKELIEKAIKSDNRDALAALGNFNLNDAIQSAQKVGGEEGVNELISCLSAGDGENLLKQWFIHRKNLPPKAKEKVKEVAKKMLIDLGIYYSRAKLGSSTTGPTPINIFRPYSVGDDIDNIDLEETIYNMLEKGKKVSHINYDDFYVYETAKGLRSACFELDISGSMSGDKLAYMAICATMLIYGMRKDELGLCFFESDTHVLKEINQSLNLEQIADELLSIESRGGTRLQAALEWARDQFKENANSRERLNVLFTDAEVFDLKDVIEELRILRSMGVDFILVCPEDAFNLEDANKMVKLAGGQLLKIKDWNEFPQLISDIIRSHF